MDEKFKKLPLLKLDKDENYIITNDEYSYRPNIYYWKDHFEIDWLFDNTNLWELNVTGNSIEEVIDNAYNRLKKLNIIK